MVDEKRVRLMTRLAIYEKTHEVEMRPVKRYSRRAYMALHGFAAFFIGSFLYAGIVGGVMALYCINNMDSLDLSMLMNWGMIAALAYIVYIMLHVFRMRQHAKKKYEAGRRHVKELAKAYKFLANLHSRKAARGEHERTYDEYEEEY